MSFGDIDDVVWNNHRHINIFIAFFIFFHVLLNHRRVIKETSQKQKADELTDEVAARLAEYVCH